MKHETSCWNMKFHMWNMKFHVSCFNMKFQHETWNFMFHMWNFMFHKWNFMFHKWNFMFHVETSKFHMWNFRCRNFMFHMLNFMRLFIHRPGMGLMELSFSNESTPSIRLQRHSVNTQYSDWLFEYSEYWILNTWVLNTRVFKYSSIGEYWILEYKEKTTSVAVSHPNCPRNGLT